MHNVCALCGSTASVLSLCSACISDLPDTQQTCNQCGWPLDTGSICGACLKRPPPFYSYRAVYWYQFPVDRLLIAAKFHSRLEIATALGQLLAARLAGETDLVLPEAIIPVPLHWHRLLKRGYNQAFEIARPVAKRLALPLLMDSCTRIRPTLPQTALNDKKMRLANVRNAFELTRPLKFRSIAIVDDVYTSGSTAINLATCLLRGGCQRVHVWTVARAATH